MVFGLLRWGVVLWLFGDSVSVVSFVGQVVLRCGFVGLVVLM